LKIRRMRLAQRLRRAACRLKSARAHRSRACGVSKQPGRVRVVILVEGPGSEEIGPEIVWSMETRLWDLGENSPPSDLSSLRGPDERSLPSSPSPALSAESWSISTTRLHNPPNAGTNKRLGLENSPYPNLEAEVVTGADEGAEPGFSLECSVPYCRHDGFHPHSVVTKRVASRISRERIRRMTAALSVSRRSNQFSSAADPRRLRGTGIP